ncbi:uncharacterized protein PAC_06017 [Phialocephala subalpina]|uniref:Uncharacterized protein n=1 Tax=Phialocephala subalpina TaxID=576137 RepID=A0A1L7WTQ2_9HELO|nr:uncharacterized protein PAC_06017 [Phialocephala subalpina]
MTVTFSAAPFSLESLTTVGGGVTAWLPVPTAWPLQPECSTQLIRAWEANGANPIAFDPAYASVSPTTVSPCLPTEFTASWKQATTTSPATTTLLGPTFVCPAAYESVGDLLVQSMQMLLCCPSKYLLATPITTLINAQSHFPSQCTSSFASGQTITYPFCTGGGTCAPTTETITALRTVFAWHMNGFNGVPGSKTSATETGSSTSTSTPSKPGLSSGAAAGIAIGAVIVLLIFSIVGCLLWGRWKTNREYARTERRGGPFTGDGFSDHLVSRGGQYQVETPARYEMNNLRGAKGGESKGVYEMDASYMGGKI